MDPLTILVSQGIPIGCPGAVGSIHLIVPPYLAPADDSAVDIGGAVPGLVDDGVAEADALIVNVVEATVEVAGVDAEVAPGDAEAGLWLGTRSGNR